MLAAGEALARGGSGPGLPLGLVGQGLGPGRLSPRDGGPLASSVGGGCLRPTMTPKGERGIVCLDAWTLCAHACVRGRQGPLRSQERALQRTWGRERVGLSARRRGSPASLEEVGRRLGWGLGGDLSPGPEGRCGSVWVLHLGFSTTGCLDLCPDESASTFTWPRARVELSPCPRMHVPTFVPGHNHLCPR